MVTTIQTAILKQGEEWSIFCTDGLKTDVVSHLKEILIFGGNVKFANCGAKNEYKFLVQSKDNMYSKYIRTPPRAASAKADYHHAYLEDM